MLMLKNIPTEMFKESLEKQKVLKTVPEVLKPWAFP